MRVIRLTKYSLDVAEAVRGLLVELSRSGKDRGEIPEEWFREVTSSPYHDLILAVGDDFDGEKGEVFGMAVVSVTMGAIVRKNAYLEDFVVSERARGTGVGSAIWEEILAWGREKGAGELEFTSGEGREKAWAFYEHRGAEIYKTNFFKKELN